MSKILNADHIVSQWVFGAILGSILTYLAIMVGHSAVDVSGPNAHLSRVVSVCPEEDSCDYSGILNRWVPVEH